MTPGPRVSVVIPTWNWSRALRCAITTVLGQTFEDFELLVVGDGCADDSEDVVASFQDQRIRWHNLPVNIGSQFAPNNVAIEMARGEFIAYLGHDDLWLPQHLQSLVHAAEQSGADVIVGGVLMIGPLDSGLRGIAGLIPVDGQGCEPVGVPPSGIMHRLDVARAIGGWRPPDDCSLAPDMDFLKRCWEYRQRVAGSGRVSVIKFNACWRPDSYRTLDATDQEMWLKRIENEPNFLERELEQTLVCFSAGKLISLGPLGPSANAPKGIFAAQMRHIRGLSGRPVGREDVPGGVRFNGEYAGISKGWYFPEVTPEMGTFRWSGPETQSLCVFSDIPSGSRVLRIHLAGSILSDQLRIETKLNDALLPLVRERGGSGATFRGVIPESSGAVTEFCLEIRVPRTLRPCDLNPASLDERRLGVMFSWVEFLSVSGDAGGK